eukprot:gene2638-8706_t
MLWRSALREGEGAEERQLKKFIVPASLYLVAWGLRWVWTGVPLHTHRLAELAWLLGSGLACGCALWTKSLPTAVVEAQMLLFAAGILLDDWTRLTAVGEA